VQVSVALFGIALLIAVCAGAARPGSAEQAVDSAAVTPEYVASLSHKQADEAVGSMLDRVVALAFERCPDKSDACLEKQFVSAFDPAGQFAPLCKVHDVPKEYWFCLMIAAETVPMVTAAGGDLAEDIDWSDIDGMNNDAREQFAEFVAKECADDRKCVVERSAALLGLSPVVAASCRKHARLSDQMTCLSDAKGAAVYQAAIKAVS
jgi:hypothetical protein